MKASRRASRPSARTAPAAWKRRVVRGTLLLVALWPFAHRGLVARFDVSPWKFGGWAMYAAPTPPVLVAVFRPDVGGWRLVSRERFSPATQATFDRFEQARHALGDFHRPDALARAVLDERPDLAEIAIVVERMRLDPATARMTSRKARYDYDRGARRP